MDLRDSRGFSLVEVLIAVAVALIIGFFCLRLASGVLHAMNITAQRFAGSSTLSGLESRWLNEEDDAWAIFTPPNDVNGNSNTDGHEVDFFNRDIKHQAQFWAYTYDANAKTLTRYVYSSLGATPTTEEVFAGVTSFYAQTYPLTALQDPTSKIYSPLYQSASLQNGAVQFFASAAPWIEGGNQITYVRVATANGLREMHLSTWTAPSGWTVVLNYTPRPSSSPTPAALTTWPVGIAMGANGSNVASIPVRTPISVASVLNGLLGGGTATAATTCPAQAYTDSALTQLDTNDATYQTRLGVYTDANGCIQGPAGPAAYVVSNESGFSGTFTEAGCAQPVVNLGSWTPNASGPTAALSMAGGPSTGGCTMRISDGGGRAPSYGHGLVAANVSTGDACSIISETCNGGPISWVDDGPFCTASEGTYQNGYTGTGSFIGSPSGLGVFTSDNTNGTWTFTRTAIGKFTVTAREGYVTYSIGNVMGRPTCTSSMKLMTIGTWMM